MELMDFVCLLLSAGAVLYLLAAFLGSPPGLDTGPITSDPSKRLALSIRELESDFGAGKLSREDYETVRRQTVEELAAELKRRKGGQPRE